MAHEDSGRRKPNYYWTDQTMDQAVSAVLKDGMSVNKASKIFKVPRKILTERVGGRLPLLQSVTGNQPLATPPVQFQYVGQPQSLVQPPSSVQPLNSTQQALRIPGPQTQGLPQTIMGPPHQVLSSGGVHPLPHTDLTVRTLSDVRGTSSHLPDWSTGAPARLHDHLPPRPPPLTGTPNGGLPNKLPPPGHDGKSGFPREISLTGPPN
uniref:Uncharacterized protein LOC111126678 n=1 Tax=Crassostrea virginica TaxID=6565 RepID=A0A8B8DHM4_CRAVI|nr:uncharacterized protein LOC111126678 [Crassostrea virginica]